MRMNREQDGKIITVPNILSAARLCLIPVFIHLYIVRADSRMACLTLLISGLTDILDGYIARHFNMESRLGRALDPIADKLTQGAMLLCLVSRFPIMVYLLVLLIVKELCCGVTAALVIKRTGAVLPASWHGKLTTFLLYAAMCAHLVWINIPSALSTALVGVCLASMLVSFALYIVRNVSALYGRDA